MINRDRDNLLTPFGKATLDDRYLLPGESYQDLFYRVATAYSSNGAHRDRMYSYISKLWVMPSTPVLSNGGTSRGLPISCFLNEMEDSIGGIADVWNENVFLASKGGGIGTYFGNIRGIGEPVGVVGKTSGIIPFIKVMDSLSLAISQGCVDGETEILTEKGWVPFEELDSVHGKVAQVNPDKSISFVHVEEYHQYPYEGDMHFYTNPGGTLNHLVTPNHRMVYETLVKRDGRRTWSNELKTRDSDKMKCHRDNRLYLTGSGVDYAGSDSLSNLERFFIAYQADGATKPSGNSTGELSGNLLYAFRFTKERKIGRMREILDALYWDYSVNVHADGTTNYLVKVPLSTSLSKSFSDWVELDRVSADWCRDFVEEVSHWDGTVPSANAIRYSTIEKENADILCAIASLGGYKAFVREDPREAPRQTLHTTLIHTSKITVGGEKVTKEVQPFSGTVYCVSVPSGMFLARRNGRTIVTGNSLRRGSAAVYLDIDHPEIEEFLEIRKPSGDFNRKSLNIHHGVMVSDKFMMAAEFNEPFDLVSPRTGEVTKTVSARALFEKLVETRIATGEPYIVFSDTVNKNLPSHQKKLGLKVKTSNLCAEITLPTSEDRTAVCCLTSLNLETWDEWKDDALFIPDVMEFLDNVLQDFIDNAPPEMEKAKYSAMMERSVGLGVMGFHSYLQSQNIPMESIFAKSLNYQMFSHIKEQVDIADVELANSRGPCPDAYLAGEHRRFSNKTAIAPTASISIIAGGTSACIEPIPANIYTHKTLSGSFVVKNKYLDLILKEKCSAEEYDKTWDSILEKGGSVQHLEDLLSDKEREVFKTSFEIDQRWLIEFAADRQPYIDQSQSLNLYIPADVHKYDLIMLHFKGWELGIKSYYYLRSKSVQRAGFAGGVEQDNTLVVPTVDVAKYEECLVCQ